MNNYSYKYYRKISKFFLSYYLGIGKIFFRDNSRKTGNKTGEKAGE